jgi:hypothetical protein
MRKPLLALRFLLGKKIAARLFDLALRMRIS